MSEEKAGEKEKREKREETREDAAPSEMPEPQFAHLIETFAVQAMIYLGMIINPITSKYEEDLGMARYQIGILEILEAKTKGNLLPDEERLLGELLHTARLAYFDASKRGKSPAGEDKPKNEKK